MTMYRVGKRSLQTAIAVVSLVWIGGQAVAGLDREAFDADLDMLAARPHRLAGREDGSRAASRYVEERLRQIGVDTVIVQEFPVIQPRMTECYLMAGGQRHAIEAVRPNVVQASVTPTAGLQGRTLYVGQGEPEAYGDAFPTNRIVVLDFDCGMNWKYAFSFGARAVLFVGGQEPTATAWQHVDIPANLPRFYINEALADTLELKTREQDISLHAACRWEPLRGRNVIGIVRGKPAEEGEAQAEEVFVLAAPLDSLSEVPELAPGARDAANAAALLQCAATLSQSRPTRDVALCFFDGQTLGHLGARAFYGAACRTLRGTTLTDTTLDERLEMLNEELEQIRFTHQVAQQPDLFADAVRQAPGHRLAVRLFREEARTLSSDALDRLRRLRLDRSALKKQLETLDPAGTDVTDVRRQLEAVQKSVEYWQQEDLGWNMIQRDLDKSAISDESQVRFEALRGMIMTWCVQREEELTQDLADAMAGKGIQDALDLSQRPVCLHMAVDFGDANHEWTFVHGDDSLPVGVKDVPGIYTGIFKTMRLCGDDTEATRHFNIQALSQLHGNRAFAPAPRVDSGGIARLFGVMNVAAVTVMDPLSRQGRPTDRIERLDQDTFCAQVDDFLPFLSHLISHPELSRRSPLRPEVRYGETEWHREKAHGATITRGGRGSAMRPPLLRDTLVAVQPAHHGVWAAADPATPSQTPAGHDPVLRLLSNAHGMFELPPVSADGRWKLYAVTFGNGNGHANADPAARADKPVLEGSRGIINGITSQASLEWANDLTKAVVAVAPVRSVSMVGYGYTGGGRPRLMRGTASATFSEDTHLLCTQGTVMSMFVPSSTLHAKLFDVSGIVMLNNKAVSADYQGHGFPVDDPFAQIVTAPHTAQDLRALNTYRLTLLRNNRIRQDSLEVLSGRAKDLGDKAMAATDAPIAARLGALRAAASYSRCVYQPLISVLKDLVTAVTWLLLLTIPFAYALERLLVGTPHIYRQIGWFSLFFALTFTILYLVNPAFRLAATPMIIFLAFTIVVLSSLVIIIMVRKLQSEVQRMQGLSVSAHRADISRLTTMGAAIQMGISTMRRRPVKTLLTTLTVILLTFTILTFSSFGTFWGVHKTYTGAQRDLPARIMLRDPLWGGQSEDVRRMLDGFMADEATVVPRYWVSPTVWNLPRVLGIDPNATMLIATEHSDEPAPLSAAIGMAPEDVRRQPALAALFTPGAERDRLATDGIFLTAAIAKALGLKAEDVGKTPVCVGDVTLTYAGEILDSFGQHRQLDGSSLLPVNYALTGGGSLSEFREQQSRDTAQGKSNSSMTQFVSFDIDEIAVIPVSAARRLGGQIRSLTVYPDDEATITRTTESLATVTGLSVFAGSDGQVDRYRFMALVNTHGWQDLLIPILLGSLIIFATMMGSIADREREIYTFSALGLAPPHVAGLFFAEAAVYAVVGGMGGYLVGQIVVRLAALIGQQFLLPVPTLNYSSMNVITTLLMVMGTILISTLYPAIKASRSANPGVQRRWRIPEPHGDLHDIIFPFTVSAYDFTGVVRFLKEHFDTHKDTSLGVFAASDSQVFRQKGLSMVGVRARVALAPFDLGIEQDMMLLSQPSDIEGVDEIRIVFRRVAGAPRDWQRSNRAFIQELRKQFLLWRSLSSEVTEHYRRETIEQWYSLPIEEPPAVDKDEKS